MAKAFVFFFFFFQAEDGIRDLYVTGVQTCALPISIWYHHHSATAAISNRLATELFKNAVEIPGPEVGDLCAAAREANAYVVVGVCEKLPNTLGTMFNSQVYI